MVHMIKVTNTLTPLTKTLLRVIVPLTVCCDRHHLTAMCVCYVTLGGSDLFFATLEFKHHSCVCYHKTYYDMLYVLKVYNWLSKTPTSFRQI